MNPSNSTTSNYVTLTDGCDFRKVAKKMSTAGWAMNHATARNVLMGAMAKLVEQITLGLGDTGFAPDVCVLKNQDTYDSLQDVLQQAYEELVREGRLKL